MATKSTDRALTRELLDLERQYWQAIKDRDTDAQLLLTADPCIVTGPQGVGKLDKDQMAAMMAADQTPWTLKDFRIDDDVEVLRLGDDVAVVAYKVHEEMEVEGMPLSVDAVESSTWIRRDGGWVCALHTEAIAGDPFGRDRKTARGSGRARATPPWAPLPGSGVRPRSRDLRAARRQPGRGSIASRQAVGMPSTPVAQATMPPTIAPSVSRSTANTASRWTSRSRPRSAVAAHSASG